MKVLISLSVCLILCSTFDNAASLVIGLHNKSDLVLNFTVRSLEELNPLNLSADDYLLELRGGSVPILRKGAFLWAPLGVFLLDISDLNIKEVQPGAFQNLPIIQTLYSSRNRIEKIENGTFNDLKELKHLDLKSNWISTISPQAFDNLPKLEYLELSNNNLTFFDNNWFFNTPNLNELYFFDNQIEEIPNEAFKNLVIKDRILINFRGNKISKIGSDIFKSNKKVEILLLAQNPIRKIDSNAFRGVEKLDRLELNAEYLEKWDENLLANITEMKLLSINSIGNQKCFDDFDKAFVARQTRLFNSSFDEECKTRVLTWSEKHPEKCVEFDEKNAQECKNRLGWQYVRSK